jgi:hypothetical protein
MIGWQIAARHIAPWQLWPQLPQFAGSLPMSTQPPLQVVSFCMQPPVPAEPPVVVVVVVVVVAPLAPLVTPAPLPLVAPALLVACAPALPLSTT